MTELELLELLECDSRINQLLEIIEETKEVSLYLIAGTIRNFVWDYLSNKGASHVTDVDLIFFDPDISYETTCLMEERLRDQHPKIDWEVKNQVYMHGHNPGAAPYTSLEEALSKFPETCTAIALRREAGICQLVAPHDIDDMVQRVVRPTPFFAASKDRLAVYQHRVLSKNWQAIWPDLTIVGFPEKHEEASK